MKIKMALLWSNRLKETDFVTKINGNVGNSQTDTLSSGNVVTLTFLSMSECFSVNERFIGLLALRQCGTTF